MEKRFYLGLWRWNIYRICRYGGYGDIVDQIERFESFLRENLPRIETFHPDYQQALGDMLLAGGKRFRPALLLGVVETHRPLLLESAMLPALALEIFHTYSLIHDDLPAMDDADLRRGFPTLHTKYGEALAILAGDALNTHAFLLLAESAFRDDIKVELVKILSRNGGSGGMVLGQAIDLHYEKRRLQFEQVVELHRNKTAKLIAASLEMGAVICSLSDSERTELYDFGIDMGILFQIQDDIIDVIQSEEEAGKTTGNDTDKNSFVAVAGLEKSLEYADELSKELSHRVEKFGPILGEIVSPYLRRHRKWI